MIGRWGDAIAGRAVILTVGRHAFCESGSIYTIDNRKTCLYLKICLEVLKNTNSVKINLIRLFEKQPSSCRCLSNNIINEIKSNNRAG